VILDSLAASEKKGDLELFWYEMRRLKEIFSRVLIFSLRGGYSNEAKKRGFVIYTFGSSAHPLGKAILLPKVVLTLLLARPSLIRSYGLEEGLFAVVSAKLLRVPCVVSVHTESQLFWTLMSGRSQLRRIVTALMENIVPRSTDVLVAVSSRIATYARNCGARRIVVIPAGVNLSLFQALPSEAKDRVILFAGNLTSLKNVQTLIHAMPQVLETFPDAKLIVLGDGPQREYLETVAKNLGVTEQVEFKGFVTQSTFAQYLRQTQVFVLPSLLEGSPKALVEAMAAGKAIVASDIPATREIIRHGYDGILVPKANSGFFAEAICSLLSDIPRQREIGARARKAAERFDISKTIKAWLDLYARMVAREHDPKLIELSRSSLLCRKAIGMSDN